MPHADLYEKRLPEIELPQSRPIPTVLQVVPELVTGGVERTAVDIAKALIAEGGRALVASAGGPLVRELLDAGAEHFELPLKSKNPVTLATNIFRLDKLIHREKVDIVHARSRAPAWSAFLAARRAYRPFVTTYHGIYNQKSPFKAFYNSVMARGDAVIANSQYTAGLIAVRNPFSKGKVEVVHRGSDLTALAPGRVTSLRQQALRDAWELEPDRPVILNLARVTPWKGQGVVIEAMAKLKAVGRTQPVAVLAGDAQGRDTYLASLKDRISELGLADQVRIVGHCADVPAALALSEIAVVASVEAEAFGRAAVEAQAAGVPVIVSDLGAVPETVLAPPETPEECRTGWRVPPGDADALASAISSAFNMPEGERGLLTNRALTHVRQHFSVEKMCEKTLEIYRRLGR